MEFLEKLNDNEKWYLSLWFIIVVFIACWPIGLIILIMRNTGNKNAMFMGTTDKRKYMLGGLALIIFGVFQIESSLLWGLAMVAGGGALLYYSKTLADKAERNKKYIDLIVNQHEGSLDNIAGICGIPYEKAINELKYLNAVGVLKNITLDEAARTVSLIEVPEEKTLPGDGQGQMQEVSCKCPGCGAKMLVIKGTITNCEYCDTPITI